MSKTAIVIGVTGLVGSALVNQLASAEHIDKVITLTRRPVSHTSAKVENHVVDFDHLEAVLVVTGFEPIQVTAGEEPDD